MHVMLKGSEQSLYLKAADVLGFDLSTFARAAMNEKVDRMRAEGKKV